MKSNEKK